MIDLVPHKKGNAENTENTENTVFRVSKNLYGTALSCAGDDGKFGFLRKSYILAAAYALETQFEDQTWIESVAVLSYQCGSLLQFGLYGASLTD